MGILLGLGGRKRSNPLRSTARLFVLVLSVAALPDRDTPTAERSIFDVEGLRWDVYFDEVTGRPYYHHADSGKTEWTIDLPSATSAQTIDRPASLAASRPGLRQRGPPGERDVEAEADDDHLITSVFGKTESSSAQDPKDAISVQGQSPAAATKPKRARRARRKSSSGRRRQGRPTASDPSSSVAWTLSRAPPASTGPASAAPPLYPVEDASSLYLDYVYAATGFDAYVDIYGFDEDVAFLDSGFAGGMPPPEFLAPPDAPDLHKLSDPAGALRLEPFSTPLDSLEGVAFRHSFATPLESPAMSFGGGSAATLVAGLEEARKELEERLVTSPADPEVWEQLGHVWRHYGNVPRTLDCYRKALALTGGRQHPQATKSSVLVSIAGVLGQMNFIEDALSVLDMLLDSEDITTTDAESNQAVCFMMVAQFHYRLGNTPSAAAALNAATLIQPKLKPVVAGVDQDPWRQGDGGIWGTAPSPWDDSHQPGSQQPLMWLSQQDPWLALRIAAVGFGAMDFIEDLVTWLLSSAFGAGSTNQPVHFGEATYTAILGFAEASPRVAAVLRKTLNGVPCVFSGIASRAIADHGWHTALSLRLRPHVPLLPAGEFPLYLGIPLFLGHSFSLCTEFTLVDCIVLLFVGTILAPYLLPSARAWQALGPLSMRLRVGAQGSTTGA